MAGRPSVDPKVSSMPITWAPLKTGCTATGTVTPRKGTKTSVEPVQLGSFRARSTARRTRRGSVESWGDQRWVGE
jgi:hypothetical protein